MENKTEQIKENEIQTQTTDWLQEEVKEINENKIEGDFAPAIKFEENKTYEIEIDFSKPFQKWTSLEGVIKKIIPIIYNSQNFSFWLNVRNPTYSKIIGSGLLGQKKFKILRTGKNAETKYVIVD